MNNYTEPIYSKVQANTLLHIICHRKNFDELRKDIVTPNNELQVAMLLLPVGTTFRAHKHINKPVNEQPRPAQESWVVISGKVKVTFYDLDNTVLEERELMPGDCSITLAGGHNYEALEVSEIYEFKTGPYYGQKADKIII